jgi:hypothetical protein
LLFSFIFFFCSDYYIQSTSAILSQPSFINPDSVAEFGRLRTLTILEVAMKMVGQLRSTSVAFLNLMFTLTVLLILIMLSAAPTALGVTAIAVGVPGLKEYCDQPLPEWLIVSGSIQLMSTISRCCICLSSGNGAPPSPLEIRFRRLHRLLILVIVVIGASFVFRSNSCDNMVRQLSFVLVWMGLSVAGGACLFLSCCIVYFFRSRVALQRDLSLDPPLSPVAIFSVRDDIEAGAPLEVPPFEPSVTQNLEDSQDSPEDLQGQGIVNGGNSNDDSQSNPAPASSNEVLPA